MEAVNWPQADPALMSIVNHLESLSSEQAAPILEGLTIFQALNLWVAGTKIRKTFQQHPNWAGLFGERDDELEYLWTSLNQMAWLNRNDYWAYRLADGLMHDLKGVPNINLWRNPIRTYGNPSVPTKDDIFNADSRVDIRIYGRFNAVHDQASPSAKDVLISCLRRKWQEALLDLLGFWPYGGTCTAAPVSQALLYYFLPDSSLAKWVQDAMVRGDKEFSAEFVDEFLEPIHRDKPRLLTGENISAIQHAYTRLLQDQSAELNMLADLYERFPRFLKTVNAPEQPTCEPHVLARLRYDARRPQKPPRYGFVWRRNSSRFKYPHPCLVPFEWCLRLFKAVVDRPEVKTKLPQHLGAHFERAVAGVDYIYTRTPGKRLKRTDGEGENVVFARYPFSHSTLPKPQEEIDWLESFVTVTEWMAKEYPDITSAVAQGPMSVLRRRLLADPSDYGAFVEKETPRLIARQLRADLAVCRANPPSGFPSLLALYMPSWGSSRASAIARFLAPHHNYNDALLQLLYESNVAEISRMLKTMPERAKLTDGSVLVADEIDMHQYEIITHDSLRASTSDGKQQEYNQNDLITTARILQQLFEETPLNASATGTEILASLLSRIEDAAKTPASQDENWAESVRKYVSARGLNKAPRHCYICGRQNVKPHATLSSMCRPCGNFNMAGSELSLPPSLSLEGKVAAVTGARVNLGYHVTLRLLRCGARVIASTRYPHDAVSRYQAEKDSSQWMDRLRIIGADFRSARDAFELAREIGEVVKGWGGTLHILINNAAQTLTDSIEKEKSSVRKEEELKQSTVLSRLLLPFTSYIPRIRGGNVAAIEGPAAPTDTQMAKGSSWVQSLGEIPYEDVISAHSVNAFVPLILIRELLLLMSGGYSGDTPADQARGYVVNVSSREGIFETGFHGSVSAKNGVHVHTNMSKAALNMITETEAAAAWKGGRVAINTVDPGYMSAAPELDARWEKPIGWEDGAGRVLWPIAVGELHKQGMKGCNVVWGRFLKHYGASRVNLQTGSR